MHIFGEMPTHRPSPTPEKVLAPAVKVARWLRGMFRCQHTELSWPFTRDGETYRTCLHCGGRRSFNLNVWTTKGAFYYGETFDRSFASRKQGQ
jgi:hypothetical protein